MRRVLVDNGILAYILYYLSFQKMKIDKELLHLASVSLIGFGGMKVLPVGTISLPVVVGTYKGHILCKLANPLTKCTSLVIG